MKFGKEFRTHLDGTLPDWRDKFLRYKPLKKLLKQIYPAEASNNPHDDGPPPDAPTEGRGTPFIGLEEWFVRILNEELEKFNDFYVDKEEEFVIRLQELKERIEKVKEKSSKDRIFTSESEFSEEMLAIRKDFVTIHGEMVLLKNYSSLNFAGLVKILKKYDKRTGGLLRLPFTQRVLHQPFFTTEPLTRLVHECEANLELLFPLEAEVIESNLQHQMDVGDSMSEPKTCSTSSSLREENIDLYRSTLAAIRTIQGLRRASSTYNPLSFASFFHNQDEDGSGAVTAENSVSSTSTANNLQTMDETDQDVHSNR
ncbi:SPX domain-containing protein 4 [Aristolochia californica]|uniref:SPX domain-containing protein 4 n=1 Tax=Aristolochia californica TaxID=171875 RepID=UPI0035DDAEFF